MLLRLLKYKDELSQISSKDFDFDKIVQDSREYGIQSPNTTQHQNIEEDGKSIDMEENEFTFSDEDGKFDQIGIQKTNFVNSNIVVNPENTTSCNGIILQFDRKDRPTFINVSIPFLLFLSTFSLLRRL